MDPTHAGDGARSIEAVLDKGVNGEVYNIGTGVETSIGELARMVMDVFGINGTPVFEKAREGDIRESCANVEKITALGFGVEMDLRTFIKNVSSTRFG